MDSKMTDVVSQDTNKSTQDYKAKQEQTTSKNYIQSASALQPSINEDASITKSKLQEKPQPQLQTREPYNDAVSASTPVQLPVNDNQDNGNMMDAKKINFFRNELINEESSPASCGRSDRSTSQQRQQLEPYTLDVNDKSFEVDDRSIDDEDFVGERAVSNFVTEIDLQSSKVQLRGSGQDGQDSYEGKKNNEGKEDDDLSQQFSIDDVSGDEEEERDSVAQEKDEQPYLQNQQQQIEDDKNGKPDLTQKQIIQNQHGHHKQNNSSKLDQRERMASQQFRSSTNDSTTRRDSCSSSVKEQSNNIINVTQAGPDIKNTKTAVSNEEKSQNNCKLEEYANGMKQKPTSQQVSQDLNNKVEPKQTASNFTTSSRAEDQINKSSALDHHKQSQKKVEPLLDKENYTKAHFQRFLAHVETREINKAAPTERQNASKSILNSNGSSRSLKNSSRSQSEDSASNKDNEDPNGAAVGENQVDQFDPKELKVEFDGWSLYKKTKISFQPVRRYQMMVDQDYKKNKVTVCAHLQNIYNSYCTKRGKPSHQVSNYFDIDKWISKMSGNG